MNMTGNSNSKSLLAKLLATENITIRHNAAAKTASFDVKNRTLEMPVWKGISVDLEDLLTVHETGHALDTPCDGWIVAIDDISKKYFDNPTKRQKMAIKNFLNVIEDARIDKRQKRRYPGSRRNYLAGYKELIERGFFGPPSRDFNTYGFIDRINLHFKGGVAAGIKFDREEMPFIKRIEDAETFAEVIAVTDEVFGYCKRVGDKASAENNDEDFDDDEDGEFDFGDIDDDGDEVTVETDADASDQDDEDKAGDKKKKGTKLTISKEGSSNYNDDDDYVPDSETEKVWQEKHLELSDTNTKYVYATIPKPRLKNIVTDYKQFLIEHENLDKHYSGDLSHSRLVAQQFQQFRTEENNSISYMVKEFEMKKSADMYSKISIAKTGVIDTNKLHSYKYNDDIFRRLATTPKGKNHGFIMFMDWSGSMQSDLKNTIKQLISMVMFCKRVQIPFEVYSFRDLNRLENTSGYDRHEPSKTCFEFQKGDIGLASFKLRNILSSRMSIVELNRAFQIVWSLGGSNHRGVLEPMGGTPLNAAIVAATELVNQFRDRNKLQIVNTIFLTDGGSNPITGLYQTTRVDSDTRKKIRYIVQDSVTKKDYHMTSTNSCMNNEEMTNILLKTLKDRTGCTLIGFYLFSATWSRSARAETVYANFYGTAQNEKHFASMKALWTEHKFMPVTSHGYDEYYIIDSNSMSMKQDELKIDPNMSKSRITKAFLNFSNKKATNRVLLQRFISSVSAVNKVA